MITSPSSNVSLSIAPQSPYSGKDVREIMAKFDVMMKFYLEAVAG